MNKNKIIITLGIWVIILPYLGFPFSLKNNLFILTGLIFVYLGYILNKEKKNEIIEKPLDNFRENNNDQFI